MFVPNMEDIESHYYLLLQYFGMLSQRAVKNSRIARNGRSVKSQLQKAFKKGKPLDLVVEEPCMNGKRRRLITAEIVELQDGVVDVWRRDKHYLVRIPLEYIMGVVEKSLSK